MIRPLLAWRLALCLVAPSALAQAPAAVPPARALMVLTPEQIDPARLLPPPPERGSAIEKAELAELHDIQAHRTASRLELAQWDQDHQNWTLYAPVLGLKFDMATLPVTAKLLAVVQNDETIASTGAKTFFKRMRPWAVDPTIKGCTLKSTDDPLSSYPSGHTIVGFGLGVVLADLIPDKAQDILARANDYGYSRMVCGMHYRSDTVAAQALATALSVEILRSPKMQADLAAARAELKAAGLTK
jgi:acid phosphatase (class A)